MPVAVVTGASRFLGRAIAGALADRGDEVRGIDVRPGPGVQVADITTEGHWATALDGADLLVHAGAFQETGDAAALWRVAVDGTHRVLQAATRAGVRRVVHLSSTGVHGRAFPDGVDEDGPVRMTGHPHTDASVAAEHHALMAAAAGDVPVAVLRLGDVYGPHAEQWTVRPVELLRRGLFVLVDSGRGILSPLHLDDAVDAVLATASSEPALGRVFHVTGGDGVPARDFFGHYARMVDRPLRSLPGGAAAVLTAPVDALSRSLGLASPMSPRSVEFVTRPGTYAIDRIAAVVGWAPRVGLEEGMARTREWLVEAGLVPPATPATEP